MRKHHHHPDLQDGNDDFRGQQMPGGRGRGGGRGPGPGRGPGSGGFGGRGPGPGGLFGFVPGGPEGPGGPGGFGPGFGPGRRRGPGRGRRGEVRKAILAILREGTANGYQIMEGIAEKSQGLWRPSPGSVYPALNLLEDEGLIEATEASGKKAFQLSDAGRAHVEELGEDLDSPWDDVAGPHQGILDVRQELMQLATTLQQVAAAGTPDQREQAKAVLVRARRDLHRIMAGDPVSTD